MPVIAVILFAITEERKQWSKIFQVLKKLTINLNSYSQLNDHFISKTKRMCQPLTGIIKKKKVDGSREKVWNTRNDGEKKKKE